MGKSILVTGGAGYIGAQACKILAERGFAPVAFDNLSRGHRWAVRWCPLEVGDTADRARLDEVIARYRPQAVMHFAALAYVGESVEKPGLYWRNNVVGSLTLLEAVAAHGIPHFIFSSTCATYGNPRRLPMDETHPQQPINPYGTGKLAVERMLADFEAAGGLRSVIFRYFNAASADPQGEIGEAHDPETHLIPLVLDVAAGRRPQVTIFGDDYPTRDGTCIRDYVHIVDLVEAHLLGLAHLEKGGRSAAFNLGNGAGFSVQEVIDRARAVTGRNIAVAAGARRPGDPPSLISDSSQAIAELGWKPRYAALDVQLEHAWRWHCRHFGT